MKFYDCNTAPSPRRVRIFIGEKGLDIETVQVDLRAGEHLNDSFRAINPHCTVPVLQLDDGTTLLDSNAICIYLEEKHPEPNLMGKDAKEKAVIATWHRWAEWNGFAPVGDVLRNTAKGMKDRAITGPHNFAQIPELAERGRARIGHFFDELDARLGESEYVAGNRFTVADIMAIVAVDFAHWVKEDPSEKHANLGRWREAVSARPGVVA